MLAGELPALKIERIAVAVVRRHAEYADLTVLLQPAQLAVVGDIAPHQIPALAVLGRAFAPQRTGPQALDRRITLHILRGQRIDDDDVGVEPVDIRRRVGPELSWRARHHARRYALFRIGQNPARPRCSGPRSDRPDHRSPGQRTSLCAPLARLRHRLSSQIGSNGPLMRPGEPKLPHWPERAPRSPTAL